MAMTIQERSGSPRLVGGSQPSVERRYLVYADAAETEYEVRDFVLANTADADDGLPRWAPVVENTRTPDLPELGHMWLVEVRYQQPGGSSATTPGGPAGLRVAMGGATQRVYRSLETIASHAPAGGTAPDFGLQINVAQSGVEGVDVGRSSYRATRYVFRAEEDFDIFYEHALFLFSNAVNSVLWRGFAPGEVRMIDIVTNHNPTEERYEIAFTYEGIANETAIEVGAITVAAKDGHDYLWVYSEEGEDATGRIVRTPIAAYVERLYDRQDFNLLIP